MFSYFNIVQQTPPLEEILFKIVDLPSVWSLLRHGGINPNLALNRDRLGPTDPAGWALPALQPTYDFPLTLSLNDRPALSLTFIVTSPRPPLLACAGILGVIAQKPGDTETFLTVNIVSARRAKPGN